jgi:hypothetical protein
VVTGVHIVIYSKDAEVDRRFFKDILCFPSVDAGHGWLIFAVPAAEVAFHPHDENNKHEMYFVCEDIKSQIVALQTKGVQTDKISEEQWGTRTTITLPGGGTVGLYEPKHPVTFERKSPKRKHEGRRKNECSGAPRPERHPARNHRRILRLPGVPTRCLGASP